MVALSDYAGREQSYVKHVFLERYLERLVHKIASVYPHIVYVDGFAGPWQSASEKFDDTSFGIALNALRRAKASWKERGRDVQMSAFLVERDAEAYKKLAELPAKYPDVEIKTYAADFVSVLPDILRDVPAGAFALFLIDPRASLGAAETPEERKAILVEAFAANLAHCGNYDYVAETTVLRTVKDRPLYCLFYATRHPKGIEAFRDCQIEALKEQSKTRAATKIRHAADKTGQTEIFQSLHEMGPDDLMAFLEVEQSEASRTLLSLTPEQPDAIRYEKLWPQVLARHVVRKTDVGQIAARLRKEGSLLFPEWEKGKRTPQPHYRTQRPISPSGAQ